MITASFLLGALIGFGSLSQASPVSEEAHSRAMSETELFAGTNYTIIDLEWEVQAFPDGPILTIGGTVEQIYDTLVKINPNYDVDFGVADVEQYDNAANLERRTDFTGSSYFCGGRWPKTRAGDVRKGIEYLYKVSGKPKNGAGPGNCGRVSCSGSEGIGAGIWWCNDDNKPKELASFGSIADGALFLQRRCIEYDVMSWISGQVFHKTNWNVFIANAHC
ncbi:hypothetical protein CSUB01_08374 [Colletotrichum sublineola]|uniref:Secreted protein n=1 Tax=Colletotrichum sublineola TaxID=1173701 RepID=A0A066X8T0_COLSU|nr:hypothetical protein CSUB01_08374 [Colletotrichum sublineola]